MFSWGVGAAVVTGIVQYVQYSVFHVGPFPFKDLLFVDLIPGLLLGLSLGIYFYKAGMCSSRNAFIFVVVCTLAFAGMAWIIHHNIISFDSNGPSNEYVAADSFLSLLSNYAAGLLLASVLISTATSALIQKIKVGDILVTILISTTIGFAQFFLGMFTAFIAASIFQIALVGSIGRVLKSNV